MLWHLCGRIERIPGRTQNVTVWKRGLGGGLRPRHECGARRAVDRRRPWGVVCGFSSCHSWLSGTSTWHAAPSCELLRGCEAIDSSSSSLPTCCVCETNSSMSSPASSLPTLGAAAGAAACAVTPPPPAPPRARCPAAPLPLPLPLPLAACVSWPSETASHVASSVSACSWPVSSTSSSAHVAWPSASYSACESCFLFGRVSGPLPSCLG